MPSLLRTLIFSTALLSVYTCVKAGTARLIGVPSPMYLVVLGTAKNLGTGAEPAPFTLSEFAVPTNSGTRYSVNGGFSIGLMTVFQMHLQKIEVSHSISYFSYKDGKPER